MKMQQFIFSVKSVLLILVIELCAFLLPLKGFFFSILALTIIDNLTALYAVFKAEGSFSAFYQKWESKRAFDTVKKVTWYGVFGLVLYIVGSGIGEADLTQKAALGLVGYIEGKSIIENIDKILSTNLWEMISVWMKEKFTPKNPA